MGSQDSQEPTERKAEGAPLANQDQEDSEAQRAPEESEAREASQANRGRRATQGVTALRVLQERGDLQALKDPQGSRDRRAPRVPQGKMGFPALLESSVLRVLPEKRVRWVKGATQVLRGHQVNRGSLG